MTRNERITQSARITEASAVIRAYGSQQDRTYRAAFLARGRFSDVLTLASRVLVSVPQSGYALTA